MQKLSFLFMFVIVIVFVFLPLFETIEKGLGTTNYYKDSSHFEN